MCLCSMLPVGSPFTPPSCGGALGPAVTYYITEEFILLEDKHNVLKCQKLENRERINILALSFHFNTNKKIN